MNPELLTQLQTAQSTLEPQYHVLHTATSVLKRAIALASDETLDAIAMHKLLARLEEAAAPLDEPSVRTAVAAFAAQTQHGLDALAFEFAHDLKEVFEHRGQTVQGRPPTLVVELAHPADRHGCAQGPVALRQGGADQTDPAVSQRVVKAYDQQNKLIVQRSIDVPAFVAELYQGWQELLAKRVKPPAGKRINLVETYSQVTLNRQSSRFWNSPARSNFKDYELKPTSCAISFWPIPRPPSR